jgi:hypothetical protein
MKFAAAILSLSSMALAQSASEANYDEAKIAPYTLPALLIDAVGKAVTTGEAWTGHRRAEVLGLYQDHVFGRRPVLEGKPKFVLLAEKADALNGLATRRLVQITLPKYPAWKGIQLMLYIPKARKAAAPVFVGLSFNGNHAVTPELDVPLADRWMPSTKKGNTANRATQEARGTESSRWALGMILRSGYAVATAYYGDIEPDHAEGWKDGLRAAVHPDGVNAVWKDNEWGAISAWAYGLSLMLDYCETDADIDAKRAAVIGHSRIGKTSLWAGATDERFGVVISNNSGEGGAAITRRYFGETTKRITSSFPHWFCGRYATYGDRANELPVDQHMLIALAAPRGIYIASAVEDRWADPHGEFLSAVGAAEVYELLGKKGLGTRDWPAVDRPIGNDIAYHIRTGVHDVVDYDWEQYLKFADRIFVR